MSARLTHWAAAGFESARRLNGSDGPHGGRLHGHSFLVEARVGLPPGWGDLAGGESHALQHQLQQAVAGLDYCDLNGVLDDPSDEHLAQWIADRLDLPGAVSLRLWAGPAQGATRDALGRIHLWMRDRFESAHRLPHVPAGHKCGRMHGHGFEVMLRVRNAQQSMHRLVAAWQPLRARLHMACLNDIAGLEIPTSEMLASWIWGRLAEEVPGLSSVTVFETASCGAQYDGQRYRIWKDRSFDSATRLSSASPHDARSSLHGHTYQLRLVLSAPLDPVMGWTVDFGDVKTLFSPVFQQLDHHSLHEVLPSGDVVSLLEWIRRQSVLSLPDLNRIELRDTPATGAILAWG
ncbi:MAG: 6-carboxytetrahydropterin synthase [Betaproteobacteria bacterium]|nr:6-carboxytetrahydropterin synthase [Betaproteobacteria bacterium]MDE2621934.1 6-carboxytetrahydropterin synthase [Betaproteobacteria bacterium]